MEKVEIKTSNISGIGLFALNSIEIGETILDWRETVKKLTPQEYEELPIVDKKIVSKINGELLYFTGFGRAINHSCNPNAKGENGFDIAIKRINPGDEITVDYVAENMPLLNFDCSCKSDNCRKLIKNL